MKLIILFVDIEYEYINVDILVCPMSVTVRYNSLLLVRIQEEHYMENSMLCFTEVQVKINYVA